MPLTPSPDHASKLVVATCPGARWASAMRTTDRLLLVRRIDRSDKPDIMLLADS
eukprot:CAMPEP_0183302838 /NCGR_PEP_ID=MMETSP0160_2-20130417/8483_1 /TAXON_ID=2839 ORGANISM="Odontella Sinensis, Strain Grunow 1884" /NCGR_SAMPLE_ID=MMETSP0160_2 /ASSEMBLY_ACC=CAM_ASM_000250 /LENGTH=53 /DNA_ID=CAMNT_0025465655 /DNA_START=138 /DNA_END=296 /DNA_ORIENTATION=-